MPSFGVRVPDDADVTQWMDGVASRLESESLVAMYFQGKVRRLDYGLYVVHIDLRVPRVFLNVVGAALVLGAFVSGALGMSTLASWAWVLGAGLLLIWNALWRPTFYLFMMYLGARRKIGRWVRVREATADVLARVADGPV